MSTREAIVRHVQELTFVGKAGLNHWTTIDSSHNGSVPAATPMELILMALGGCTGGDVVSIFEKKRVQLSKFEMRITGERAKEYPKV